MGEQSRQVAGLMLKHNLFYMNKDYCPGTVVHSKDSDLSWCCRNFEPETQWNHIQGAEVRSNTEGSAGRYMQVCIKG